jgi:hypothetical protein
LPVDRQSVLSDLPPGRNVALVCLEYPQDLRLDSSALLIGRLVGYVRGHGGLVGTLIGTFDCRNVGWFVWRSVSDHFDLLAPLDWLVGRVGRKAVKSTYFR